MQWELKEVDKYVVVNKVIGQGKQAKVHEAYRKETLQQVAAKVYKLTQSEYNQSKNIIREISISTTIKHPYILECYDVKKTASNVYMFLEYCDGGDLEKYLFEKKFISETECLDFFKQIVSAFTMLEKRNIAHRDLKPANILLKNGQLKIADFGLAKEINSNSVMHTIVGSPIFMCPQALDDNNRLYDLKKADVWSAGVCLYLMLYGTYPFYAQDIKNLKETLNKQNLIFKEDVFKRSDAVKDLLSHMLEKDEEKRYTWSEVAKHKCLNPGQHYQDNPLLGSLEMNQVSGISSFNSDLKNVEIKDKEKDKMEVAEYNQSVQNTQQGVNQTYRRRDNVQQMKQIHCILRLQSQFALIYRIIWKGFFQLLQQQQQVLNLDDKTTTAIFLLLNSLLLKEHKFLRDLIQNPIQCVKFRVKKHKIPNITDEDYTAYFNSEIFMSFFNNLKMTFQFDTQNSLNNQLDHLQAQIIAVGFDKQMTEKECNKYIEISLSIINQNLKQMSDQALNQENKTLITLILYLFFLQNKEERLQDFTDPIDHFQKLLKELESINFMDKQQIYNKIQLNYENDIKRREQMEEEDDDDDDDEDDNVEDNEENKYT